MVRIHPPQPSTLVIVEINQLMNSSKKYTKKEVELETLMNFLQNKGINFNNSLLDKNKIEPSDIRYDGVNYQITIGDKEQVQEMRKITSKGQIYVGIRNISNIFDLLLKGALTKKVVRSDKSTILLVDVFSTGNLNPIEFENGLSKWAIANVNLCKVWKEIYLVFRNKNVRLNWE